MGGSMDSLSRPPPHSRPQLHRRSLPLPDLKPTIFGSGDSITFYATFRVVMDTPTVTLLWAMLALINLVILVATIAHSTNQWR